MSYLAKGSLIQQRGYQVLQESQVLQHLSGYDPMLAGTLPLDLFIDGSDLDIPGYTTDLRLAEQHLSTLFGGPGFHATHSEMRGVRTLVAVFRLGEFPVEVFLQPVPTRRQAAYIHLVNEYRVLQEKGDTFRDQVLQLKMSGLKTEPAFAKLLGLSGDPYDAMLQLF